MVYKILLPLLLAFSLAALAEHPLLEGYIQQGLESNLALQQKEFSLAQSLQALKEARGMFLPAAGIEARYSRAGGGREIDFPIGDLINPIHQSLNALLQQSVFPANLKNERIRFLREEEHDTKLRVTQPLFQPAIYYNYKIRQDLVGAQTAERDAYIRQLVADIKRAYFNYLKTARVKTLFQETETLLQENLRVSEKLFQADKVTEDAVFRARVELSSLTQQQAEAERDMALAGAYFNFLLNRDLEAEIREIPPEALSTAGELDLPAAEASALARRDELAQLGSAIAAARHSAGAARAAFLPGVTLVLDYGFQGEKYRFGKDDDYWMASGVLQWNLFNGFRDQARVQQAKIERRKLEAQRQELEKQLQLQVREAYHNLIVASKTLLAAQERVESARQSFRIVSRKYREGMSPQIEFLDARTTLTNAEIGDIIARYDYQIRRGEYEHVAALLDLEGLRTSED